MATGETTATLDPQQLAALRKLASAGTTAAAAGLTEMVGQLVELNLLEVREVPLAQAYDLIGEPEALVAGIYVGFQGDLHGHVALILEYQAGLALADLLMGDEPGQSEVLDELSLSALAEVGNITGSYFVNSLADALGLTVHVTPPAVVQDMAASIVSAIAAEVGAVSDVLIAIRTEFTIAHQAVTGEFFVVPDPASLTRITTGDAA